MTAILTWLRECLAPWSPERRAWHRRPREPQLIGGRYDGLTERDTLREVHVWGGTWIEILDTRTGRLHRYERRGEWWVFVGAYKEAVR